MVTDGNYSYCDEQYTSVRSPCCTPETTAMLYVNYTSIKKKRREAQLAVLAKFLRAKLFNILSDYLVPASQMWVCYFIILLFS